MDTNTELLVKDPSLNSIRKDSVIPNGMNGSYDDDTITSSGRQQQQQEGKSSVSSADEVGRDSEEEEEEEEDGMEIDSGEYVGAGESSLNRTTRTGSGVGEVSRENNECAGKDNSFEPMDVDARSNASDIECLGDETSEHHPDLDDDEDDDEEDAPTAGKNAASHSRAADSSRETSDLKICEENGSLGSPDIEEITDGDDDNPIAIDNSSDIEEIKPEDPLAVIDGKDKENSKQKSSLKSITGSDGKNTIVVNDTKRLVEIAAGSKNLKGGKKEPTLVIIDTNSILSGKGGVPISNSSSKSSSHHQSLSSSHLHHGISGSGSSTSSFTMTPIGVGSQQIYGNTRTTITPVPMKLPSISGTKSTTITPVMNPHHHHSQQTMPQQPMPILPTLTDDMFVVEAPSFIVPYVYEKPPLKPLKDFVDKLDTSIKEYEQEEKLKKLAEKEKNKADGKEDDEEKDSDEEEKKESKIAEAIEKEKNELAMLEDKNKIPTYFDLPLGKFFISIGVGLVQEYVQTDLLRTQKRKHSKGGTSAETQMAINSLIKTLEFSKENNEPFHFELKKCEFCNFKTESALVMQHHLETPHMRNYVYKCNYCPVEVRSPHDILFHMEAEHNIRGRLERGPAFHQCPNCPFEDNQKGKLTRHILACTKKFRPERNLEPSMDWDPPAKIPRLNRSRNMGPQPSASALAMAMGVKGQQPVLPKLLPAPVTGRGRGRPPVHPRYPDMKNLRPTGTPPNMRGDMDNNLSNMMYRPTSSGLMVPTPYQFNSNNQIFQVVGGSGTVISAVSGLSSSSGNSSGRPAPIALVPNVSESQSRLLSSQNTSVTNTTAVKNPTAKLLSQPSISITPLPRTTPQPPTPGSGSPSRPGGKSTFVICEICDGYIKDLEQLRNHMQWIHKVKIHPKMIYNRPPLNCQKCQFRFFTDQGLERHLLGSHGLVTSSMQEAANKGKDAGRCPACGRVYQWKLLNHVARDHNMTLKPAHLSYKCTVCTATFGMYKQFESHVYSAHSVVAKRVMDKKSSVPTTPTRSSDSLLKPLKINDEITIIPQPAKPTSRSVPQGRGK